MVLKLDKHGSWQIGQTFGLSIVEYYYIFTTSLFLLLSERTMKALFAYEIQYIRTFRNSVNESLKDYNNVNTTRVWQS